MALPSLNTACDHFIQLHNLFTLLTCSDMSLHRLWSYFDRQFFLFRSANFLFRYDRQSFYSDLYIAIFIQIRHLYTSFVILFSANGRYHHGPPRGLRVVHEAHGERTEGAGRVPRGLGLDSAAYEWLPHRGVPPGNASLQIETFLWIHGQLLWTLRKAP